MNIISPCRVLSCVRMFLWKSVGCFYGNPLENIRKTPLNVQFFTSDYGFSGILNRLVEFAARVTLQNSAKRVFFNIGLGGTKPIDGISGQGHFYFRFGIYSERLRPPKIKYYCVALNPTQMQTVTIVPLLHILGAW